MGVYLNGVWSIASESMCSPWCADPVMWGFQTCTHFLLKHAVMIFFPSDCSNCIGCIEQEGKSSGAI